MNQILSGNNSGHDDEDVSNSSDDSYTDGETDSDDDEHENENENENDENIKSNSKRCHLDRKEELNLEWEDESHLY